jgi:tRNA (cmo5U34)-methyltransferase
MSKSKIPDFFNKEVSLVYDELNNRLAPISECLYFMIGLILKDLPPQSKVLCVGVGTGAEILSLSKAFPGWTFVGVEPSAAMLEVCRERLKAAGVIERCELIHGYIQDAPMGEHFDVALSILVGHFVAKEDKLNFFQAINSRLRQMGILINAEISFDLDSKEFPAMLKCWGNLQALRGADSQALEALPQQLRETLSILPPKNAEQILRQSGVPSPVQFFQAFMIGAWFGKKESAGI